MKIINLNWKRLLFFLGVLFILYTISNDQNRIKTPFRAKSEKSDIAANDEQKIIDEVSSAKFLIFDWPYSANGLADRLRGKHLF